MEICYDSAQHPESGCNGIGTEEHLTDVHNYKHFQEPEYSESNAVCIKSEMLHNLPAWFLSQILDHDQHKIIHAIKDIIHMRPVPDAI